LNQGEKGIIIAYYQISNSHDQCHDRGMPISEDAYFCLVPLLTAVTENYSWIIEHQACKTAAK